MLFVHKADITRCSRYHRRANCITGKDRQYVYLGPDENRELCTALESPTVLIQNEAPIATPASTGQRGAGSLRARTTAYTPTA